MNRTRARKLKVAAALAVLALSACSKVPSGVIAPEEMAQLLADIHTGESVIDMNRMEFSSDSAKQAYKQSVYARHGVTAEQVDSSFGWYGRNISQYMEVYDRTIEILDRRLIETGNRIAADAALSIAGDSVDVWPNPRFITFNSHMPSRFATFSFAADENWEPGDSYTWRAKFFNHALDSRWTIAVEYTDGSVEYIARKFSGDGWNQLVIHTDSTLTARRGFGFFEGEGKSGTDLRLDSIEMVRKRLNPEKYAGRHIVRKIRKFNDEESSDSISGQNR